MRGFWNLMFDDGFPEVFSDLNEPPRKAKCSRLITLNHQSLSPQNNMTIITPQATGLKITLWTSPSNKHHQLYASCGRHAQTVTNLTILRLH
jgi:hypothetical protein